jgi:hypothetical protein
MTTLSKPVIVVPAIEAVTATTFDLVDVQENYGYGENNNGFGPRNSVITRISFPTTPVTFRTLIVWEGDAYLAVRGSWTDDTLRARIAEILEAE